MRTIVAMLALAIAASAHAAQAFNPNAPCTYVDNVEWKNWGGARYAASAEEALTDPKLDWYLKCSTAIPTDLKAKVKEAIRAKPKGEQMAYLTPDMTLLEMASGPDRSHSTQHLMRNVKVARIQVALGIVRAAETPIWSVKDADGKTYVVGDPFLCGNLSVIRIIPAPPKLPVAQKPPATPVAPRKEPPTSLGQCPDIYTLVIKSWAHEAFFLPGVEQTHAKEDNAVVFVGVEHVSRKHGKQFREANAEGKLAHSKTRRDFRVSLIMTREAYGGSTAITEEEFYGDVTVTGFKELLFTRAQLDKWDAIRVVAVNGNEITSPPKFAATGLHEMRFFNKLPGTTRGEWDNPQERECLKREHWIEQPQIGQKQ